jgi:TolB protein
MRSFRSFLRNICTLTALASLTGAHAQNDIVVQSTIDIVGRTQPIWVSLGGFSGEAEEVIRFDLYVQGFNFTNAESAKYLLSGSANGNLTGRAADHFNTSLVSRSYTGGTLRRQAHMFVDDFIAAIPGHAKGIGQTKIAFKVGPGIGDGEIYIADFDGHNAQAVTHDETIVAAPAWVPGKLALCYTSYKLGNPDIFYHDLSTGERRTLANFSGLNTSAAPSPDGHKVAMILSKSGSPDVWVANTDGSGLTQLTKTPEDESSPCWSPDGQWICFATKVQGRRQLAKVPAAGGALQRITTAGVSNPTEPDWSPDGKYIAFTRQGGDFDICVVPASGGTATLLVSGEDPSWSPNSRTLIFGRRVGGRYVLSLLDVLTKQTKDISRLSGSPSSSQPSWAK